MSDTKKLEEVEVVKEAPAEFKPTKKPEPEAEFTRVLSGGREVNWRKDGETWECHNGNGVLSRNADWQPYQDYLDGKRSFPG